MKMVCPLYMTCRRNKDSCCHKTPHEETDQCDSGYNNGDDPENHPDRWSNPDGKCPICIPYTIDNLLDEKDFEL